MSDLTTGTTIELPIILYRLVIEMFSGNTKDVENPNSFKHSSTLGFLACPIALFTAAT